ncbi:SdrD B-like domain-containing protein, partial [Mammaliicoccus stepanovicii]
TKTNVGTDDKDSDGQKVTVVVNNKDDMTIDSGFHKSEPPVPPTYNVGDKVWEDTNKDGIQDDNEPGIKDVTVTLT